MSLGRRPTSHRTVTAVVMTVLLAVTGCSRDENDQPSGPCDSPPPVVGVSTGSSILSMDAGSRDALLDRISALGVKGIRVDVPWPDLQPTPPPTSGPVLDPAATAVGDGIVDAARERGLTVMGVLDYTPGWAASGPPRDGSPPTMVPPRDPAEYARFAAAAASHFAGRVESWEIGNEPNLDSFSHPPDPHGYARLVAAAAPEIRKADPAATVVAGALSVAYDRWDNRSPTSFVDALEESGALESVHAVSIHPYSYPHIPDPDRRAWTGEDPHEDVWSTLPAISRRLGALTPPRELWVTEFGSPTGTVRTAGGRVVTIDESAQSEAVSEAIGIARDSGVAQRVYLYTAQDPPGSGPVSGAVDDAEQRFGLYDSGGRERESARAVRAMLCGPTG